MSMDTADRLYRELSSWRRLRERCAGELRELVAEIEELNKGSRIARVTGASVATAGCLSIIGAGILTVATAGLAAPALGFAIGGTVASIAGAATSAVSSIVEAVMSSEKMEELKRIIEDDEAKREKIKELLERLRMECLTTSSGCFTPLDKPLMDAGAKTQKQMNICFLKAVARQRGLELPDEFFEHMTEMTYGRSKSSDRAGAGLANAVLYMSSRILLKEVAEELGILRLNTQGKGAAKIARGAVGLGLSLYDLVTSSIELAKDEPSEACKALRDNAKALEDGAKALKESMDQVE
ncbi:hypothetical protein AGOR_G00172380 [Albula goreensis]|uniref:Apolipoprotein L3 n=1 Tax=Albula goreensis TaxID=1534307 RepID=A0A8T3CYL0_9TELE|nr:hypothetical protein AGOR_G00172380 [Albula goreensis]